MTNGNGNGNGNGCLISLKNVTKVYQTGKIHVDALRGVDLEIGRGEFVAVIGPSGSGKSTLMNIMGCLDAPTSGEYHLDGRPVANMTIHQLAAIRNQKIGFIFQNFNLLAYATTFENVELPLIFAGKPGAFRKQRTMECLERVGLANWAEHRPTELSGGQMQRAAIARALANDPDIILADEPTGNLDSKSGGEIIDLFVELNRQGRSVVTITHDMNIAHRCHRIIKIMDGLIESEKQNGTKPLAT